MLTVTNLQPEAKCIAASRRALVLITAIGIIASVSASFATPGLIIAPDGLVTMMATNFLAGDAPPRVPSLGTRISAETLAQTGGQANAIALK